jgi:hypothetical protein
MLARLANDADVRAEPNDLPFRAAARMRLTQTHYIAESNLEGHSAGIIRQLVN